MRSKVAVTLALLVSSPGLALAQTAPLPGQVVPQQAPVAQPFPVMQQPQYVPVSNKRSGTEITRDSLAEAGLIKATKGHVKVLANGQIEAAITVKGLKVSSGAREKIVAAGGRVEE